MKGIKKLLICASIALFGSINQINAQTDYWNLNGNSGSDPATNFIGTIDNKNIVFKRNNINSGYIGFNVSSFGVNSANGGAKNSYFGAFTGSNNTGGNNYGNSFFGYYVGVNNTGAENVALGYYSFQLNTTGSRNIALGTKSLGDNVSGSYNVAIGNQSLLKNTIGNNNISIGGSLTSNTEGIENIALGKWCLINNDLGSNNIGMGTSAGYNSRGSNNIFIGSGSGNSIQSGNRNNFIGYYSGNSLIEGNLNVFLGDQAGYNIQSGGNNLFLGNQSGMNVISGSDNIFIGKQADPNQISLNNSIILSTQGGQERFRFVENGNMGIGTSVPNAKVEIKGATNSSGLRFTNLTNTNNAITNTTNKVLSVNDQGDIILVNDLQGSGSGSGTIINAGTNINVVGNATNGYTISSPTTNLLSLTGNDLTSTVNGVASTVTLNGFTDLDEQTLAISGDQLSISNGNTITLPSFVDTNTDEQTLSLTGNQLTISNGNTVDLPAYNGSETIIQAGNNVTVTGIGTNIDPYIINANGGSACSIYECDGVINSSTTIGSFRTINMNDQNLFFNTSTSSVNNGKIYLGSTPSLPTTTGYYRMYVEGGILTEKVKVALRSSLNWADYVFGENYTLMPLNEVEKYIVENKHLPNMPSAENLKNEGLDLGEMQAKQMEKIEELTLYIIQQQRQLEKQAKELEELKGLLKSNLK